MEEKSLNTALVRHKHRSWLLAGLVVIAIAAIAAVVLTSRPASSAANVTRFEFGLWGDVPYNRAGTGPKTPVLINDMNAANLAFTVFNGDTKDGASLCTDQTIIADVRARFDSVKAPTVYVPGDNEWTDCHRTNNGSYNNLERLNAIRRGLFNTNQSFGQTRMTLTQQGAPGAAYSENTRWVYGGVVFAGINVPGSNNNYVAPGACINSASARTQADCDADNVEYLHRDAYNLQWLRGTFDLAKRTNAPAVMIVIQANPGWDIPETEDVVERTDVKYNAAYSGYNNFVQELIAQTVAFKGEVVLVHGDSHFFKIDKPLYSYSSLLKNFTRVQTFGESNAHWVKVTVDPNSRNIFVYEPMIVPGN